MTYIGVDYGDSRTGLAIAPDGICAVPYAVIDSSAGRRKTADAVARIAFEKRAGCIVIGYPLNMDGSSGRRIAVTEKFAAALKTALEKQSHDASIIFWDERLTSRIAESKLRESGTSVNSKGISDQIAAAAILQDYLDSIKGKE